MGAVIRLMLLNRLSVSMSVLNGLACNSWTVGGMTWVQALLLPLLTCLAWCSANSPTGFYWLMHPWQLWSSAVCVVATLLALLVAVFLSASRREVRLCSLSRVCTLSVVPPGIPIGLRRLLAIAVNALLGRVMRSFVYTLLVVIVLAMGRFGFSTLVVGLVVATARLPWWVANATRLSVRVRLLLRLLRPLAICSTGMLQALALASILLSTRLGRALKHAPTPTLLWLTLIGTMALYLGEWIGLLGSW